MNTTYPPRGARLRGGRHARATVDKSARAVAVSVVPIHRLR